MAHATWVGLRSAGVSNVLTPVETKENLVSRESAFAQLPRDGGGHGTRVSV